MLRPGSSAQHGGSLTRDETTSSYAIIRHNVRTYESAGVVEVIRGKTNAEASVKNCEENQTSEDRHAGWRYFLEKTGIKPGTSPADATHKRQAELELRERQALDEPSSTPESR